MPLNHLPELLRVLEDGIKTHRLTELREAILEAAEPCILLYEGGHDEAAAAVGATRFGGLPELPDSTVWPEYQGKKLPFIAQLDLAALPRFEGNPLPGDGWLWFFACVGDNDPVAAVFSQVDRNALQWRYVPEEEIKPTWSGDRDYDSVPIIKAKLAISLTPDRVREILDLPDEDDEDIPEDQMDRLIDLAIALNPSDRYDDRGGVAGQVLGLMNFPGALPNDAVEFGEQEGDDWMNLLEVQSVGSMMWSDCGMLNILIRRSDLDRRDFSQLVGSVNSG